MSDTSSVLTPEDQLPGVPPGAQLWDVGGKAFVVFQVPGTERFYGWHVTNLEQLSALGGSKAITRKLTPEEAAAVDFTSFGVRTSLVQFTRDPVEAFVSEFERQARVLPMLQNQWIADAAWGAFLEGRALDISDILAADAAEQAETGNPGYWSSRTPAQREWETFVLQQGGTDSAAVQQRITAVRDVVLDGFVQAGMETPPAGLVDRYTDLVTSGRLLPDQLERAIRRETDPFTPGASPFAGRTLDEGTEFVRHDDGRLFARVDGDLWRLTGEGQAARFVDPSQVQTITGDVVEAGTLGEFFARQDAASPEGTTVGAERSALGGEEAVRGLVMRHLGPVFGGGYSNQWIAEWAGKLRANPEAEEQLVDLLRARFQAAFPAYIGSDVTYADVAGAWQGWATQFTGGPVDETEDWFVKLIQMNDAQEGAQFMRLTGAEQGWEPLKQETELGLARATGGFTRRPV